MKLDLGSFAFGSSVVTGGNTPSWGTSLGQKKPDLKFTYPGYDNIIIGMMYKSIPVDKVYIPLGKGGHVCNSLEDEGIQLAALFDKVYINEVKINAPFIILIYQDSSDSWAGRRTLKYNVKIEYRRGKNDIISNADFVTEARKSLNLAEDACWVVSDIYVVNQDELHLIAGIVNSKHSEIYPSSELRKAAFIKSINTTFDRHPHFIKKYATENLSSIPIDAEDSDAIGVNNISCKTLQTIFYGCPGTGKSHRVEQILKSASKAVVKVAETAENRSLNFHQYLKEQPYFQTGDAYHFAIKSRGKKSLYNVIIERGLAGDIDSCFDITDLATLRKIYQSIKDNNPFLPQHQEPVYALEYYIKFLEEKPKVQFDTEFRTTFHPDSDYASFVGCYKPTMIEGENDENRISYAFVPQVFTNAYVRAWELYNSGSKENVYLVIEEINRGNCAQIFGDLFQLLDRYEDGEKAGFSKYKVDPDADLSQYLVGIFDKHDCAKKLCLPPNLNILATMNTSDQSLFPMDSAFKRRWSWKYVPIDYAHEDSSKFTITIGDRSYSWNKFLQDVNERIKTITQSEDKQIGNFFIAHADIKQDEFINKVMFYLWSEICKDNYKTRDNFFRNRNNKDEEFSFNDLFGKSTTALLQGFMAHIAGEDAVVEEEAQEMQ